MGATFPTPVLALGADAIRDLEGHDALSGLWKLFTKCKESLQDGHRLENISWRLWYREIMLTNCERDSESEDFQHLTVQYEKANDLETTGDSIAATALCLLQPSANPSTLPHPYSPQFKIENAPRSQMTPFEPLGSSPGLSFPPAPFASSPRTPSPRLSPLIPAYNQGTSTTRSRQRRFLNSDGTPLSVGRIIYNMLPSPSSPDPRETKTAVTAFLLPWPALWHKSTSSSTVVSGEEFDNKPEANLTFTESASPIQDPIISQTLFEPSLSPTPSLLGVANDVRSNNLPLIDLPTVSITENGVSSLPTPEPQESDPNHDATIAGNSPSIVTHLSSSIPSLLIPSDTSSNSRGDTSKHDLGMSFDSVQPATTSTYTGPPSPSLSDSYAHAHPAEVAVREVGILPSVSLLHDIAAASGSSQPQGGQSNGNMTPAASSSTSISQNSSCQRPQPPTLVVVNPTPDPTPHPTPPATPLIHGSIRLGGLIKSQWFPPLPEGATDSRQHQLLQAAQLLLGPQVLSLPPAFIGVGTGNGNSSGGENLTAVVTGLDRSRSDATALYSESHSDEVSPENANGPIIEHKRISSSSSSEVQPQNQSQVSSSTANSRHSHPNAADSSISGHAESTSTTATSASGYDHSDETAMLKSTRTGLSEHLATTTGTTMFEVLPARVGKSRNRSQEAGGLGVALGGFGMTQGAPPSAAALSAGPVVAWKGPIVAAGRGRAKVALGRTGMKAKGILRRNSSGLTAIRNDNATAEAECADSEYERRERENQERMKIDAAGKVLILAAIREGEAVEAEQEMARQRAAAAQQQPQQPAAGFRLGSTSDGIGSKSAGIGDQDGPATKPKGQGTASVAEGRRASKSGGSKTNPLLATDLEKHLSSPLLPQNQRTIVLATSESDFETDSDAYGSWSSEEMTGNEEDPLSRGEQLRQELLHQQHLQQLQQRQRQQQHQQHQGQQHQQQGVQRTQSGHYPAPNNTRHGKQSPRAQQRRQNRVNAQAILDAAAEAQRQREMLVKLPTSSFQNFAHVRANSAGLLTQLMNPNPDIFPPKHPYRRAFTTTEIKPSTGGVPPIRPLTSITPSENKNNAAYPPIPEEHTEIQGGLQDKNPAPPPAAYLPPSSRMHLTPPSRPGGLNCTKSAAAIPVSSHFAIGSVGSKALPVINHNSAMPPPAVITSSASKIRLGPPPADAEMEDDSDDEADPPGGISESLAHEKLKTFARNARIAPNHPHPAAPSDKYAEVPTAQASSQATPLQATTSRAATAQAVAAPGNADDNAPPKWVVSQPQGPRQQQTQHQPQQQHVRTRSNPQPRHTVQFADALRSFPSRRPADPIPVGYPYNLPISAIPSTPRTTRQQMLSTELPECLRRNLLWERQVSNGNLPAMRRSTSGGASSLQPPTAAPVGPPPMVELRPRRQHQPANASGQHVEAGPSNTSNAQPRDADVLEAQRRRAMARNRTWANDYHVAGW